MVTWKGFGVRSSYLNKAQIFAINRARHLLQEIESKSLTSKRGYGDGRLAEACKLAEGALFNVLVVAKHWVEEDVSEDELHTKGQKTKR